MTLIRSLNLSKLSRSNYLLSSFHNSENESFELIFDNNNDVKIHRISKMPGTAGTGCFVQLSDKRTLFFAYIIDYDEASKDVMDKRSFFLANDKLYEFSKANDIFNLERISLSKRKFTINQTEFVYDWSVWKNLTERPFSDAFNYDTGDFFHDFMEWTFGKKLML